MTYFPSALRSLGMTALACSLAASVAAAVPGPRPDKPQDESRQIEQRQRWLIKSRGLDQTADARLRRTRAVQDLKQLVRTSSLVDIRAGETWTPIGPASMTMLPQWPMGRVSGRLNVVAPHPTDDNTLYVGAAAGGVWKTTNAGVSWTSVFDAVGTQPVSVIHVEAAAPQNLWVGTGDKQGLCAGYYGQGVYLSTDGGTTWTSKNGGGSSVMPLGLVTSVALQPTNSNVVLAGGWQRGCGSARGIYRSTDRAGNWSKVYDGDVEDIVFVPNSSTVYATVLNTGVIKSTNGGATWTAINSGLSPGGRMRLAIAGSDPNTIYLLTDSTLYRTTNGGTSWQVRNSSPCTGQCNYNLALAVHPTDPNKVLVGTVTFGLSTDGGANFTDLNVSGGQLRVHYDTHALLFSRQNANRFWVGTDGGLWRTEDLGTNWVNMNSNLNITQFYDLALHPTNADTVFGGAQDNSSSRRSTSDVWDTTVFTGDGMMNAIDAINPNVVFQTSQPGPLPQYQRSTQSGAPGTFEQLANTGLDGPFPWVTQVVTAGSHVYTASDRIFRALTTTPAGSFAWTPISNTLSSGSTIHSMIAVRSGNATRIYAAAGEQQIFLNTNADTGSTWSNVTGNFPTSTMGTVEGFAVDPGNVQRVFVVRSTLGASKLLRTTSGGTTWTALGAGLPDVAAYAVAIDPLNTSRIFVGTDLGVYVSNDGGANFVAFMAGFPLGTPVQDLEIDNNPHVLVAGTFGRGAWKAPLQTSGNQLPVAGFGFTTNGLTATFTDSSSDADGTIVSRSWDFGDGTSSSATSPSKTYTAAGAYTVILTVTDNGGGMDTEIKTVTVGASNVLSNGVAVTGLSAATGGELRYTMVVPANATGLKFVIAGSNGDADIYARFGSAPTTSSYTCRAAASGSNETCTITTAQAGTYHVLVKAYSAFSGLSLTGSYNVGTPTQTYTNGTDVTIPNNATVESSIAVTGRSGNAPSNAQIAVNIIHPYIGDLKVDLVAADGSVYVLHNRSGGSTDNINQTYTVNLSSELLNGTWKLRVNDNYQLDSGYINSWSITF